MKPAQTRALVTGASGGIGRALAAELHRRGAAVMLVGRDAESLRQLARSIGGATDRLACQVADVATREGRRDVADRAVEWQCNALVNNAGVGEFAFVDEQTDAGLERLFAVNALAPMQLTRALLPHLRGRPEAAILNVGSVFGSLAYPGFAAYSASKFALRGFTEALRRELADTRVTVHYLAPRSTRTGMNASAVERMNVELGVAMDPPELVAQAACDMLQRGRFEAVLGWPEKLFVRINALLPRIVDGSLRRQLPVIRRHACLAAAERTTSS
ncbi:MAG TPA: SDR family oxidoreductase [Steroidobacteraceae bacterium]|nr:SDR family oxidoreductase [Steroidobacteraceae bacterium]